MARSYTKDNTSSRQGEQLIPAVTSGKMSIRKIIALVLCLKCHQEESVPCSRVEKGSGDIVMAWRCWKYPLCPIQERHSSSV